MSALERKKAEAEERRLQKQEGQKEEQEAVLRLEGDKRWVVRYQNGTPQKKLNLTLDEVNMRQAIRIEDCRFLYITLKSKVNSVTISNCKKVQVALDSVVSSLEVLNSEDCDVQVELSAPTISVENSTSVNLILLDAEESRNTEVVTSCSSTVNVNFPSIKDKEDFIEKPIPEQFISRIVPDGKGGYKVETKPNEMLS
ncbi:hypothetical protein AGDE_01758 [Angomonas deanei]|nr:hypothetical protein AGDE_01758 [Angomonas deanei]|eukprot:EPY42165.1 hypothetical protein AGDE_01758 [Angomonas deanei]